MPKADMFTLFSTSPVTGDINPVIYRYHSSYRPSLYFCCTEEEEQEKENLLYMGFELEFDYGPIGRSTNIREKKLAVIEYSNNLFNSGSYLYYMLDGSLTNGLEMISQPSTLNFYKKNKEKFEKLFAFIKEMGFSARVSCGLHIHFNKDFYFNEEPIKDFYFYNKEENLLYLIDKFWKELVYLSGRRYNRIRRWSNKFYKGPKEIVEDMMCGNFESRYHVLNFRNRNTIEIRLFHSTLEYDEFISFLELYNNLIVCAKMFPKEKLEIIGFQEFLTSQELVNLWVKRTASSNTNKYKKYLEEENAVRVPNPSFNQYIDFDSYF